MAQKYGKDQNIFAQCSIFSNQFIFSERNRGPALIDGFKKHNYI